MKKSYGLPYKGSKTRLAEEIVNLLPQKKVLVDLFGGGGAISICASQNQKFDRIIYNELNTLIAETFQKAINGEYENERRWISSNEYYQLKDKDMYVYLCYSFNGNGSGYIYSFEKEPYERAYHYAIAFNDFEPFNELFNDEITKQVKKSVEGISDLRRRRLNLTKVLKKFFIENHLNHRSYSLEKAERFRCSYNSNFECIEVLNKDYADVELPSPEDCVIYCDIPYSNTWQYKVGDFEYERFYKWCQDKASDGYQIYVSSYELPEDLFTEVWTKGRHSKAGSYGGKHVIEKIFIPKCNK